MITKSLGVVIDQKSWGRKPRPLWATGHPITETVDVGQALLMLGSMTTPNGLSAGSPERYWACMRYFSACTASPDLRIRTAFMDLDPHQKGILSDDLGVALSTAWLVNKLGGVQEIVDGRQFMINMGIRRSGSGSRPPKVGRRKCPDFVLEDQHGKLHVLECKGTQSGRGYLEGAMRTGRVQKQGIKVAKAMRGESLVIGLSLAGEGDDRGSELVVIDPDEAPVTVVREADARRASEVLARLTLARNLNLSGFSRVAFEIAWPEDLNKDSAELDLLTLTERKGLSIKREDRQRSWEEEFLTEFSSAPRRQVDDFVMQEMRFDLPSLLLDSGDVVRRVSVRRGLSSAFIQGLSSAGKDLRAAAKDVSMRISASEETVGYTETEHSARLDYRGLFFSEISFD